MRAINFFYISILLFSYGISFGQNNQIDEANKKFKKFAYVDAREIYLKVAENGYRTMDLLEKLGDSYYLNGELESSVEWYAELTTKYSDYDDEYLFRYSQSLKSLKLYKEADKILKKYYVRKGIEIDFSLNKTDDYYLDLIESQSDKFTISPFSHNSKYSDFSPQFFDNESLVFSSSRDTVSHKAHHWNNEPFLDLYHSKDWEIKKLDKGINTKFHEASAIYTRNRDTMYFSRNNYTKNKEGQSKKGTMLLKIYRAVLKDGEWKSIKELPFNSNNYSVAHPALSPDGKKMYFASDMPGTLGKSDIFVVDILEDGKFSEPKNLGKKINTVARETFPFISKNGKLYFSSDGHFGLGGLDIFVSSLKSNNTYKDPYNLSKPINSTYDDFSFILNPYNKQGYFASNRPGGKGGDDIYKCEQTDPLMVDCNQTVKGRVTSFGTTGGISACEVNIFDSEANHVETLFTDNDGYFKIDVDCSGVYHINVKRDAYQAKKEVVFSGTKFDKEIDLSVSLKKTIKLGESWVVAGDDLNKVLGLSKIYFDSNKSTIKLRSKIELQKIIKALKSNPNLKLKIKSYTDYKGPSQVNKELSKQRSLTAKQYIVEHGKINQNRIQAEGLGESNPIVVCNGNCSEVELEMNRRSEFIIIE